MSVVKAWIVCTLIVCFAFEGSLARMRREVKAPANQNQNKAQEPSWLPATGPREFTVNVDDHIKGANQHRHEKWTNGTVVGSYASPGRDGKWLKVEYAADDKGFRITSTKELTPEELMADQGQGANSAKDHTAHIGIQTDDNAPIDYTVTEDQLKNNKNKDGQQQKSKRADFSGGASASGGAGGGF